MTAAAVVSHARQAKPAPRKTALDGYMPQSRASGKCKCKCIGGKPCAMSDKPHQAHLCTEPDCACRAVLRGPVTYAEPLRRYRIALSLTQGNMLDLLALVRHIGGKRTRPGVGRAPYTLRGAQERR